MSSMKPLHAGLATFALALAFYWGAMNLMSRGFVDWYLLARTGQSAIATVTEVTPSNHQRCAYTYRIDGRTFAGHDSGCAELGIGGTLAITYLPSDPAFATRVDPQGELEFEILGPLALASIAGIVTAARLRDRQGRSG